MHGRHTALAFVVLVGTACTEPKPLESDAGPYPYLLTPTGVRVHGRTRILVIPAKFAGGAAEPMSAAAIQAAFFPGGDGPASKTFSLASDGKFTLLGEVTSWVQTSVPVPQLGDSGLVAATRFGDYVLEAIHAVDDRVDFGVFDNDGPDGFPNSGDDDGYVDGGVVVMNSDRNTTCGIAGARGLHPHANLQIRTKNGNAFATNDASASASDTGAKVIKVGAYLAMGVQSCGSDIGGNVLSHELGHLVLGLPDFYHVVGGGTQVWEGRRWVIGCWDLMAAGSGWGCGQGIPPASGAHMSTLGAYTRSLVGWTAQITVNTNRDTVYTLLPPGMGGTALRVPVSDSEYFLVEYREHNSIDVAPPANGVLIYHIDRNLPRFPAVADPRRYRVRLVEADGDDGLIRTEVEGGNRGVAGDAFGPGRSTFATDAHPAAITTAGAPLPFSIVDITVDAANHRATVRIKPS